MESVVWQWSAFAWTAARRAEELTVASMITKGRRASAHYLALVRAFPLRPLRSERELDRAIHVIDRLLEQPKMGKDAQDYLAVLSSLVEQFEESRHPIAAASDADLLAHLLEARGIAQAQLARETGIAESTVSAVLGGSRTLTRQHVGKLAAYFHISPAAFDFDPSRA